MGVGATEKKIAISSYLLYNRVILKKSGEIMSVLYWLEGLRCPALDAFFSFITLFGDEVMFMAIALIVFWCADKKQGYYLFCVGFFGTVVNQFLKITARVPRPWVKDPNFTVVEGVKEGASGYSFPSGHTQSSVGMFGGVARWNKNRWLRIAMIAMCVLVPFSRMYLGVHTPADVLTSTAIALVLVFAAYPLFQKYADSPRGMMTILSVLAAAIVAQLAYLSFWSFPPSVYEPENIHNLLSAKENACSLLGCMLGFLVIYPLDYYKIRFSTKGVWWVQILKTVVGLCLVLAVKELTKSPLVWLCGGYALPARVIRYFLIAFVGGGLWPMTFGWWQKLGQKK